MPKAGVSSWSITSAFLSNILKFPVEEQSLAAFLSKVLFDAGFNLGVYSSPHLVKINEIHVHLLRNPLQVDFFRETYFGSIG